MAPVRDVAAATEWPASCDPLLVQRSTTNEKARDVSYDPLLKRAAGVHCEGHRAPATHVVAHSADLLRLMLEELNPCRGPDCP